ncbi:sensor domain-containing diguanylate cyclase [Azospira restricta]|uniref:diguanylate cyclase n=1 Tax=Azospira restricta TaxID=404405 RepID=A0A974SMH2_9RHOO|nr:GGDEF domain-containing protein [Azospira restricta]QRJ62214.1 GGDEF domain-containing protein [Azospira restricta]
MSAQQPYGDNAAPADPRAVRFVVLMTVVFLAFLWSFVSYWAISSRQETVAHTEQVLRRLDSAVEEQTRRLFKMVEIFLGVAGQWIADNPQADPRRDPRFLRLIENFRERTGNAIEIQLAAEDGTLTALGSSVPPVVEALADKDFFRAAIGGDERHFHIGAPQATGPNGLWQIPVAHRLQPRSRDSAALVAAIRLSALLALYEEARMRPNGAIVLLRRDGILLARAPHDERLIGKSVAGGPLYREFLPRGERGFARIGRTAIDGMDRFVSYSVLGDLPLVMAVSAATDDVMESWRRQMLIIVLLASGVSVASLLAARRLARVLNELSARNAELQHLATTDLMTGVHNRHHFLSLLYHEFARGRRHWVPLSLMVLDLDFFKQINDGYGHAAGDEALRAFARAAKGCLREMDAVGRLGGEEFAILLPNTQVAHAEAVAERIRAAVARIAIETEQGTVRFTTSIGVTQTIAEDESVDAVLARADAALYNAKAAGRNRVMARLAGELHSRF